MADAPKPQPPRRGRPARALQLGDPAPQPVATPEPDAFDLTGEQADPNAIPDDLGDRVRQIAHLHGKEAAEEYTMKVLQGLLLQGKPVDEIARQFNVTTRTIYTWKARLRDRQAEEARAIDPYPLFGGILAHFDAIQTEAWSRAKSPVRTMKDSDRARFLDIALRSTTDRVKFLKEVGLFEAARIVPKKTTEASNEGAEAQALLEDLRAILSGAMEFGTEVVAEEIEGDGGGE
ncbi:hypothetical protein [Azospirillum argentinense]|uniref:helix-turn-helix domain-containing protein n=1 Tax=Azospirillum argentinense TaxID=2970906 RepID=UPI0032DFEAF7